MKVYALYSIDVEFKPTGRHASMGLRQSPIFNDNKLKLGFFSPNCSGGMAVTKVP